MDYLLSIFKNVSERKVCKAIGQPRSTQRYQRIIQDSDTRLISRIVKLACQYGRYGYRRVAAILRSEGWQVNHKKVERIWRREGLKVPQRQPRRKRLWLNDGSCVRMRPEHPNYVWSYDFVMDRTYDGRSLRMLTLIDEYTRECLTIDVARKIKAMDVVERLADLFVFRGTPEYIRSDNGPEFVSRQVRHWQRCSDALHRTGKPLGERIY
jgi:transposase InsO family protein